MARNTRFCHFLQKRHRRTNGRTDQRTNGRTDTASYRDARTHLKMSERGKKQRKNLGTRHDITRHELVHLRKMCKLVFLRVLLIMQHGMTRWQDSQHVETC